MAVLVKALTALPRGDVRRRVRVALEFRGETQATLASKARIHRSKLSEALNGHAEFSVEQKAAISDVLDVPCHVLFPQKGF